MKIFTKLLIPIFLIAFCFTGYGASVALGVSGEGVYMPVKTANANTNSREGLNMLNHTQSFDEGRLKLTLSAYPNPTKGLIQIELQSVNESGKQMQLGRDTYKINFSNTIGKVLKTIKVPKSALDSKINLDLSDYPAGVYFYSLLVNDKMVETKRLILQQ